MNWVKTDNHYINLEQVAAIQVDHNYFEARVINTNGFICATLSEHEALAFMSAIDELGCKDTTIIRAGDIDVQESDNEEDYPPLVVEAIANESF